VIYRGFSSFRVFGAYLWAKREPTSGLKDR
jgi:hypothetical protein